MGVEDEASDKAPRAPRPGDPFARPAPLPKRPKKVKRKKGRTFFLVLLVGAGVLVGTWLIAVLTGRDLLLNFYKDFAVPRGVVEMLPPDYPVERARELVGALDAFFEAAGDRRISNEAVLAMMQALQAAQADAVITPEEAERLQAEARAALGAENG